MRDGIPENVVRSELESADAAGIAAHLDVADVVGRVGQDGQRAALDGEETGIGRYGVSAVGCSEVDTIGQSERAAAEFGEGGLSLVRAKGHRDAECFAEVHTDTCCHVQVRRRPGLAVKANPNLTRAAAVRGERNVRRVHCPIDATLELQRSGTERRYTRRADDGTSAEDGAARVIAGAAEDDCAVEVRVVHEACAGTAAADDDQPWASQSATGDGQSAATAAEAVGIAERRQCAAVTHVAVSAEESARETRACATTVEVDGFRAIRRQCDRAGRERRDAIEGGLDTSRQRAAQSDRATCVYEHAGRAVDRVCADGSGIIEAEDAVIHGYAAAESVRSAEEPSAVTILLERRDAIGERSILSGDIDAVAKGRSNRVGSSVITLNRECAVSVVQEADCACAGEVDRTRAGGIQIGRGRAEREETVRARAAANVRERAAIQHKIRGRRTACAERTAAAGIGDRGDVGRARIHRGAASEAISSREVNKAASAAATIEEEAVCSGHRGAVRQNEPTAAAADAERVRVWRDDAGILHRRVAEPGCIARSVQYRPEGNLPAGAKVEVFTDGSLQAAVHLEREDACGALIDPTQQRGDRAKAGGCGIGRDGLRGHDAVARDNDRAT